MDVKLVRHLPRLRGHLQCGLVVEHVDLAVSALADEPGKDVSLGVPLLTRAGLVFLGEREELVAQAEARRRRDTRDGGMGGHLREVVELVFSAVADRMARREDSFRHFAFALFCLWLRIRIRFDFCRCLDLLCLD